MSVDIDIKHTEDWILDFLILDEDKNPVTDLLGATGTLQIRSSSLSTDVLVEVEAVIDSVTGSVKFTVLDTDLVGLLAEGDMRRSLVYGTRITYTDGIDEEPVAGRLKLYRGVVR